MAVYGIYGEHDPKTNATDETFYKITVNFLEDLESNRTSYENIYPGNEGMVNWDYNYNKMLNLSWSPPEMSFGWETPYDW